MPLDIDSQNLFQNAQFQQFVDFAETAVAAGKQKAVARFDAGAGHPRTQDPRPRRDAGVGRFGRGASERGL